MKQIVECPLCEDKGYFVYDILTEDDTLIDHYLDSLYDTSWINLTDEEKKEQMDEELKNYFTTTL
tara:strand:- start:2288 stop:2482 length:195 start_codon:yes stop_codon:yes gene_type:complete